MAKPGRKPAGRDTDGRPMLVSKDYVQATLRLSPLTKDQLDALAVILRKSQADVVTSALEAYLEGLPAPIRRGVEELRAARVAADRKR